jgi:hypothetical protein
VNNMPGSYRVVEYFKQNLGDGPRYKVQLREWVPGWLSGTALGAVCHVGFVLSCLSDATQMHAVERCCCCSTVSWIDRQGIVGVCLLWSYRNPMPAHAVDFHILVPCARVPAGTRGEM